MARENSKYRSFHLTKIQDARFVKLAERCQMNPNSLMRLICETLQPSDVEQLVKRS
jgi:hypothetical protein